MCADDAVPLRTFLPRILVDFSDFKLLRLHQGKNMKV